MGRRQPWEKPSLALVFGCSPGVLCDPSRRQACRPTHMVQVVLGERHGLPRVPVVRITKGGAIGLQATCTNGQASPSARLEIDRSSWTPGWGRVRQRREAWPWKLARLWASCKGLGSPGGTELEHTCSCRVVGLPWE